MYTAIVSTLSTDVHKDKSYLWDLFLHRYNWQYREALQRSVEYMSIYRYRQLRNRRWDNWEGASEQNMHSAYIYIVCV